MSWWAIDIRTEPASREALSAWLVGRTGQAVEERADGTLVTFATSETAANALMEEIHGQQPGECAATSRPLEMIDWSLRWRDGLAARRFGRLVVTPSWIDDTPEPDTVRVVLDPETAFGSGEHGSTRAALALLERIVAPGDRVLDLGSGSGILAIAATKLGAVHATGVEIDGDANEVAERNAARNGVTERTAFMEGDAGALAPLLGPADVVLSNILRTVNVELMAPILAATRPGGIVIFSGMETAEAELFRPVLAAVGLAVTDEVVDAGWWAVAATRP